MEENKIKLHPIELYNEVALCIAYCIGATNENAEQIANTITICKIEECVNQIRNIMLDK